MSGRLWLASLALAGIAGCSAPANNGADPSLVGRGLLLPDFDSFPAVEDAMQPSCGTLDCHGNEARNLRLHGARGLRLDPGANPADDATTDDEYAASYRSIVLLEPEAMSATLLDQGRDPLRLSLVRKARNSEKHKGGTQMLQNDPLDRCVVSWLEGATDVASCRRVSRARRPEIP